MFNLRPSLPILAFVCGLLLALVAIVFLQNSFLAVVLIGMPCLHGILIAKSAVNYKHQAISDEKCLNVELVCAGLLVVASLIMLQSIAVDSRPIASAIAFVLGLLLSAIATLPVVMIGILNIITAVRQKRERWQSAWPLLLNSLALSIYLMLLSWLSVLLPFILSGKHYMGN